MEKYRNNIRLIFAYNRPSLDNVRRELLNLQEIDPEFKPFSFFQSTKYEPAKDELTSTKLIRQRLYELNFLPTFFFPDLPISIVAIVCGTEKIAMPLDHLPQWSRDIIASTHVNTINLDPDGKNLGNDLTTFYEDVIVTLPRIIADAESNYMTRFVRKSNLKLFFSNDQESSQLIVILKRIADCRMMQQRFTDAAEIYRKLIEFKNPNFLTHEAMFYYSLCRHILNTQDNIEGIILQSIPENPTVLQISIVYLTVFHTRNLIKNKNPNRALYSLINLFQRAKDYQILIPYLLEESAKYYNQKKAGEMLMLAGENYKKCKFTEHACRCLYLSLLTINRNYAIFQKTAKSMIEVSRNLIIDADLSWIVEKWLSFHKVEFNSDMEKFFAKFRPKKVCFGGFVRPIIVNSRSDGFVFTPPPLFSGSWPEKCKTVYKTFSGFESFEISRKKDTAINRKVTPTINLRLRQEIELKHVRVKSEEENQIEAEEIDCDLSNSSVFNFPFTPLTKGDIKIIGIEYELFGVHLFSPFSDKKFEIFVHDAFPFVSLKFNDELNLSDVRKGDIFVIDIKLKNESQFPLSHLSLQSFSENSVFKIVKPFEDDYYGFKFLKALKPQEEYDVKISVEAQDGRNLFGLIFPYWSEDLPPRYQSLAFEFVTTEQQNIKVTQKNLSSFIDMQENLSPLFFDSKIFNTKPFSTINGKTAIFSQISILKDDNEEVTEIPDFISIFQKKKNLMFWYLRNSYFYNFIEIKNLYSPLILKMQKIKGDKYQLKVSNIGNYTIHGMKISFLDPDELVTFLVSGLELKIIEKIDPEESILFEFFLTFFGPKDARKPSVMIAAEEFLAISELPFC
ncbi:hypothetical protein TVAG_460650 [Trichomonas vaginalis G3]|uniref:Uncharacterized protein n=1 Tax=Trichomonas vaginalis (strain ATCC PRA-98 / G3) TaxID=412133 RepID=A2DY39_TRIV3|nr:hypothetical protein TVAG_460650 [Trichomonas vaginalis G3]|eukprot:XP_001326871.1 hypothetical protein [Trichomonas vaginalis G3]